MVFFTQATGAIVLPLLAALFVGQYLDNRYQTAPWIFLGLTMIAFGLSCLVLVIMSRKYLAQIEKDILKKDDRRSNNQSTKSPK